MASIRQEGSREVQVRLILHGLVGRCSGKRSGNQLERQLRCQLMTSRHNESLQGIFGIAVPIADWVIGKLVMVLNLHVNPRRCFYQQHGCISWRPPRYRQRGNIFD